MLKTDAAALGEALNGLAETFDKKPVGAKAAAIWFETLKEFPNELVRGMLNAWPRTHGKFPTPAEVWKIVNDVQIAEREQIERNRQKDARVDVHFAPTEAGRKALAAMRKVMETPRRSAKAHWHNVLETAPKDSIGYRYAKEVLAMRRMAA